MTNDKNFYKALFVATITIISALLWSFFFLSCDAQITMNRLIIILMAIANIGATICGIKYCGEYKYISLTFIAIGFFGIFIAWDVTKSKEDICKRLEYYNSLK